MKMIIDTDPGIDDAMAILYAAAHPGIELLGLTTVFGNVTARQATRNALHLVERAGLDIPVAQGENKPLVNGPIEPSHHVHGPDGFGEVTSIDARGTKEEEGAAAFLVRIARQHRGELVLCPVGPMTNIAKAMLLDPEFAENLAGIVFMGGALDVPGNVTPHAEANAYHDPHALDLVLKSGAAIRMIGLDVTNRVLLDAADFDTLAQINPAHGPFLQEMSRFYLAFYAARGQAGCGLHDPLTVMAAVMPDLLGFIRTPVEAVLEGAEGGATRRATHRPTIEVATACEPELIKELFFAPFRCVPA
ncbi:nucleoside hydrolase [Alloyangia pacifica]|uniref:nucleoside hydrolase n=1 Tax=Alloyangia pacifica TaxID=311180 RepID=UPI001CD27967|nr:nucleoside hydrolase [Alloyangia pacifica]MCA0994951.1 nucleoside hydrolase [Alloyangia pacifica]